MLVLSVIILVQTQHDNSNNNAFNAHMLSSGHAAVSTFLSWVG